MKVWLHNIQHISVGAFEELLYVYLNLKQICVQHFEELPIMISKKELFTFYELNDAVREPVKHFAEEFTTCF